MLDVLPAARRDGDVDGCPGRRGDRQVGDHGVPERPPTLVDDDEAGDGLLPPLGSHGPVDPVLPDARAR